MVVLVKLPGPGYRDLFHVVAGLSEEGEEVFVVVWQNIDGDRVYCQL